MSSSDADADPYQSHGFDRIKIQQHDDRLQSMQAFAKRELGDIKHPANDAWQNVRGRHCNFKAIYTSTRNKKTAKRSLALS